MPRAGDTVTLGANFGAAYAGLTTVQFKIWAHDLADTLILDWTSTGVGVVGGGRYELDHVFPSFGTFSFEARATPSGPTTGEQLVTIDPSVLAGVAGDFLPTLADVGALLRARTVDTSGVELGTFTAETRPTGDQVDRLIELAGTLIASSIGTDVPAALLPVAANLVAIRAAMLVELSYFPEQLQAELSPYTELKALCDEALRGLTEAKLNLGAELEYPVIA